MDGFFHTIWNLDEEIALAPLLQPEYNVSLSFLSLKSAHSQDGLIQQIEVFCLNISNKTFSLQEYLMCLVTVGMKLLIESGTYLETWP